MITRLRPRARPKGLRDSVKCFVVISDPGDNNDRVVSITRQADKLILEIEGWDKLWAFKSRLEIPLANVSEVRADPAIAHGLWKGIRARAPICRA